MRRVFNVLLKKAGRAQFRYPVGNVVVLVLGGRNKMSKKIHAVLLALLLTAVFAHSALALEAKAILLASGLQSPVELKESPDGTGRRFIVEQTGTIRIVMPDGKMLAGAFLDLRASIVKMYVRFDERGTLGLAFHPNYRNNGKFYVYYSAPIVPDKEGLRHEIFGNHTAYLSEFKVSDNPNVADRSSERVLMKIEQPQFNHNGGDLEFGPDGYLYISLGDGGLADDWGWGHNKKTGNAQDLSNLLGKILRIDVDRKDKGMEYAIPRNNPFRGMKKMRGEIFAYGFRNPWRMSFDTGGSRRLFVADVQQNSYEEVNIVTSGGNYGWRVLEGNKCFDYLNPNKHLSSCDRSGKIAPIFAYNHCVKYKGKSCFGINVQGGVVYRGSHRPWQGKYFFGDWGMNFGAQTGRIYAATERGGKWSFERVNITNMPFKKSVLGLRQDLKGNVYVMTSNSMGPLGSRDEVYQLVP